MIQKAIYSLILIIFICSCSSEAAKSEKGLPEKESSSEKKTEINKSSVETSDKTKPGQIAYPDSHFGVVIPKKMNLVDMSTEGLNVRKYTYSNQSDTNPQIYRITVIPPLEQYKETYTAYQFQKILEQSLLKRFTKKEITYKGKLKINGVPCYRINFSLKTQIVVPKGNRKKVVNLPIKGITCIYFDPSSFWSYQITTMTVSKSYKKTKSKMIGFIKSFRFLPFEKDII